MLYVFLSAKLEFSIDSFIIPLLFDIKQEHTSILCVRMIYEFCQTTQQNSFPLSIPSFVIILLHLSPFILKLRGVGCQSSPKTKSK